MDSSLHIDERQAYVKTGEYVNRKWNHLSHHQLATYFKYMEKELANGRECIMAAKYAVDSIIKVNQTKGFIICINSKVAGEYRT